MMQYPVALRSHYFLSSPTSPASSEPSTPLPENEPKVTKITNCRILRDHKIVEKDSIWIQDGKIIDPNKFFWYQKRLPDVVLDAQGLLVVPGFIEAQINGAFGVDFSVPLDHDTYEQGLLKVNRGLLKFGTTSYCPTIVSSSASVYHKVLSHLKPRPGSAETGATVLGAHVEGPFINKARNGAHELKVLQASAPNGYKDFKDVYGFEEDTPEAQRKLSDDDLQCVKIITCAPELEGVLASIPDLVKAGITVSIGHSMANISQAEEAVKKGATFITHLFNAMPQFHHRDPGVIGLLGSRLDFPRPYYGLICDGIHVHPNSVKIAYDSHPDGVILVTDAMSAMGLAPRNCQLGNINITKEEDRVYIKNMDIPAGRASGDTHNRTHTHQFSEADRNNQPGFLIDNKKSDVLRLDDQRGLKSGTAPARLTEGPSSPSDEVHIEDHNEGFLPTPPDSTPLSPLTMAPGSPDHQCLRQEFFFAPLEVLAKFEWTIETAPSYEYEEHMVYDAYEEHHGSEHSVRFITLHFTDEDYEDSFDGVSIANSGRSHDLVARVENKGAALEDVHHHRDHAGDISQDNNDISNGNNATTIGNQQSTRQTKGGRDNQRDMSDCGCHHDSNGENRSEGRNASNQGGSIKAHANVNDDGDLCCPSSSVITLDACMRNFIKFTHCSLVEAVEAVTLHPAVLLGIQETKGVIKPGADADLVFLSEDLFVKRVFVAGEEVDLNAIDVEAVEKF
ncbi:hypothetical protein BGZ58_009591 [Dissophora ornata]|nr:hypothetical protein BGZ58_009591 [Dissophora ornata]